MNKHTEGFARVAFGTELTVSPIGISEGSKFIADCKNQLNPDTAMHNARRVAALWNLMSEFKTDEFEGKTLADFIKDLTRLNHMNVVENGINLQLEGGACGMLVEAFAAQFTQSGAKNYLELSFVHPDIGDVTVTMQRMDGLTPSQKLDAMTKQRDELVAAYENLRYMETSRPMSGAVDHADLQKAKDRMKDAIMAAKIGNDSIE